ncbi:VOC family protein [Variovorax sp. J22P168]|uniref:VOC family protein n=1 Tax=Variovorax jilinensis TaxID=3053513 RepID=UPI0025763D07|nr:VOC family protein [Variovorax sp. J22P168]MDM0013763.1 VOC family protein [Variovorax sp. J22P168]
MTTTINWFEIPVADLGRAQAFYEKVLGRAMKREDMGGEPMAIFAYQEPATGGCLVVGGTRTAPAGSGVRIYLDCTPSIDAALSRVAAAGGQVATPKTALPADMGYFAVLRDTEGNEVGLHALA